MYLISSSGYEYEDEKHGFHSKSSEKVNEKNQLEIGELEEKNRCSKLKKAKEELKLYRLLKKDGLIRCVTVVTEEKVLDINTSTSYELCEIKGIGKTLSKRIVDYRVENGIFNDAKELINVKGIGEKKLSKIINN